MPIILDPPSPASVVGWEEVYGPDYPWNWLTLGQPADCPVLSNGRCRVRYDANNTPGFKIDYWSGTAWVEQGKMVFNRAGDTPGYDDTWQSASLVEWSPARAVSLNVFKASVDAYSRELVYITLQRGWSGPRFEIYPGPKANAAAPFVTAYFFLPNVDANDSAAKIDAAGAGAISATAGTGSALLPFGSVGATTFTGENEVMALREGGGQQINLAVVQSGMQAVVSNGAVAYAAAQNAIGIFGTGYLSVHLGFCAQQTDQIMEAESIRNVSGTTSQVADATASAGQCVKDTQITEAAATLSKSPTSLLLGGKYRVFARVKVDTGATGSFRAYTTGSTPVAVTGVTSTTWTWIDMGDLPLPSATSFFLNAWRSGGGATPVGSVYVDRVELFKVEDRITASPQYDGGRDLGQSVLTDSRTGGVVVAR